MDLLLEQLKALADSTRLRILKLVQQQELCVCQIVPLIGLSQPTVSIHLAKLKRAGLVKERRAGQWAYYTANEEGLAAFQQRWESFLAAELEEIPELRELASRLSGCCRTKGENQ